jgi:hypothetical protein
MSSSSKEELVTLLLSLAALPPIPAHRPVHVWFTQQMLTHQLGILNRIGPIHS